jgi:hypothetical protein
MAARFLLRGRTAKTQLPANRSGIVINLKT